MESEINYKISGDGPTVILIHGLFGNLDNLNLLAKHLSDQFQIVRIDLPNHGQSCSVNSMDYHYLAEKLIQFINKLDLINPTLIGHSMGGKVAMATALSYPSQISRIVVADTAPVKYRPRHVAIFKALTSLNLAQTHDRKQALSHLLAHGIEIPIASYLLKNLQRIDNSNKAKDRFKWRMNLLGLQTNYQQIIGWPYINNETYTKPVLFIKGQLSDYIEAEYQSEIVHQFPNAQAKIIANAGHWLHSDKPIIFNRIVQQFLQTTR